MRKIVTLAVVAIMALFSLSYAQSSSLRLVYGVGYGNAGVEYEWPKDDKIAYSAGVGLLQSGTVTGFTVVGGTQLYFLGERQGPYASVRFATGWVSDGFTSAEVYLGLVTGGYRLVIDRLEFSGEVGIGMGNVSVGLYDVPVASTAFGLSVGYRF